MTLNGDFFYISSSSMDGDNVSYTIRLDPDHPIYLSHFPGNPVTPGALIIKMVRELSSLTLLRNFDIEKVSSVKFTRVISPVSESEISVSLTFKHSEINKVNVIAIISHGEVIFSKINLLLRDTLRGCVLIPTYNNADTLLGVIDSVREKAGKDIIVVNDGSTDGTADILKGSPDILVVSYAKNRGKGYALSRGFEKACEAGYSYAITMDSDGQHFAQDIPLFIEAHEREPEAMIVGNRNLTQDNMPTKNTFANRFSNFWFSLQTLRHLPDTQTGFRLYPLYRIPGLKPHSSKYEAELEMLVRSAWKGVKIVSVPIKVYYAPEAERVSHFRPGRDFARISVLNTILTLGAIIYGYPSMLLHKLKQR